MYLTSTYPEYPASLFAANDFVSSYSAVGCSASSGPTFRSLGVVKGWNLLAALDCGYIALVILYISVGRICGSGVYWLEAHLYTCPQGFLCLDETRLHDA